MSALQEAPPATLAACQRCVATDPGMLRRLCTPLGPRLGLLQVRCAEDWRHLVQATPQHTPCPDFTRQTVVGLVSWVGTPTDGHWPLSLTHIRVVDGGGLLEAHFVGGTYLPDGTACLETAVVDDLKAVLVVNIDGTLFYPNPGR